jgi:hypothetical protein
MFNNPYKPFPLIEFKVERILLIVEKIYKELSFSNKKIEFLMESSENWNDPKLSVGDKIVKF